MRPLQSVVIVSELRTFAPSSTSQPIPPPSGRRRPPRLSRARRCQPPRETTPCPPLPPPLHRVAPRTPLPMSSSSSRRTCVLPHLRLQGVALHGGPPCSVRDPSRPSLTAANPQCAHQHPLRTRLRPRRLVRRLARGALPAFYQSPRNTTVLELIVEGKKKEA